MTQPLVRYEEARRALREAVVPAKAREIRNKMEALEHYAKRAKDRELEVWAAEIRVRAERRIGELLIEAPKHRGGRPAATVSSAEVIATLERLGISKKESALAQRLAAIPESDFEARLRECHDLGQPPRGALLARVARDDKLAVHYSSASDEHYTPKHIVERVASCFGGTIDLDPCCNPGQPNVPAKYHFRLTDNGLAQPWHGQVYCNPPYGNAAAAWVEKAIVEFQEGRAAAIILLLGARTDTGWFHALRDFPVCFIRGRLTFIGNVAPAPFPSALFWLSEESPETFAATFEDVGAVYMHWTPEAAVRRLRAVK